MNRDELLAGLLAAPLDGFVAERNRLARELRASGDRDTAAWLGGLRRPTPHVWALDQLAQRDPRAVRTLTNLGRRLAEAQGRAVRGGREAARLLSAVAPTFGFGQVADVPVADAMRSQATEVVTREKLSPEVISGKEVFEAAEQADRELFERRTEQRRAEDAVAAARAARREADRLRSSR